MCENLGDIEGDFGILDSMVTETAIPPDLPGSLVEKLGEKSVVDERDLSVKKLNKSWVAAAQNRKELKRYEVEILMKEGKQKVEIPDEVITDSTPLWEDFVVGKFLDLAPHVAKKYKIIMFEKSYKRLATLLMSFIYITNEIK